ncbi:MAG: hypothetical protein GY754_00890 [bacterium]|nr:hypothetical protein [bacterium]
MAKAEVIIYREEDRIIMDERDVAEFIKQQEEADSCIKCLVVKPEFDDGSEEEAKRSCSGSGRMGKRIGPG